MKQPDAWVGDTGFGIDFPSDVDLSQFTECRVVIERPVSPPVFYSFDQAEFQSVEVGGVLSYIVQDGVFSELGWYHFQVFVRDATRDLALMDPVSLLVGRRLSNDVWNM